MYNVYAGQNKLIANCVINGRVCGQLGWLEVVCVALQRCLQRENHARGDHSWKGCLKTHNDVSFFYNFKIMNKS